jgi:hypothetical protein
MDKDDNYEVFENIINESVMEKFKEVFKKSLECKSDLDEGVGHFSRHTLSLFKLHIRRHPYLSYSAIERLCWDRYHWEKKFLRDENEK